MKGQNQAEQATTDVNRTPITSKFLDICVAIGDSVQSAQ